MRPTLITPVPWFPEKVWKPVSPEPRCGNPHCCNGARAARDTGCNGLAHHGKCCHAPGNRVCGPGEKRILYARTEPDLQDTVRRAWMARWLGGQCSLRDAMDGYRREWALCANDDVREAA